MKKKNILKNLKKEIKENYQLYLMFLLPFIWFLIFCYLPMSGLTMAFTEYELGSGIKGFFTGNFVGLEYFKQFVTSNDFGRIVKNTLVISLLDIVVNFTAPIILAIGFDQIRNKHFKQATQVISYLPKFISMVIIVSILKGFLSYNGLFNNIGAIFGKERVVFLGEPKYFYMIFTLMNTWATIGWSSIIYVSAMSGINPELYEAAEVDGAGNFQKIFNITLPSISLTITIMFILRMGNIINVALEPVLLLVPYRETVIYKTAETLALNVYRRGVIKLDYSYATAVGFFQSIIGLIFVTLTNKIANKVSDVGLW